MLNNFKVGAMCPMTEYARKNISSTFPHYFPKNVKVIITKIWVLWGKGAKLREIHGEIILKRNLKFPIYVLS